MPHYTLIPGLPDPDQSPEFYANVPLKRGIAWLIDCFLIGLLGLILTPFTAFTAIFFWPAFFAIVGFVYRWWTLSGGSSTWGMRMMGIEMRTLDGRPFDSALALMHTGGYTLSVLVAPLQLVSILMMLLSGRKQGLTDHLLGTAAINRGL